MIDPFLLSILLRCLSSIGGDLNNYWRGSPQGPWGSDYPYASRDEDVNLYYASREDKNDNLEGDSEDNDLEDLNDNLEVDSEDNDPEDNPEGDNGPEDNPAEDPEDNGPEGLTKKIDSLTEDINLENRKHKDLEDYITESNEDLERRIKVDINDYDYHNYLRGEIAKDVEDLATIKSTIEALEERKATLEEAAKEEAEIVNRESESLIEENIDPNVNLKRKRDDDDDGDNNRRGGGPSVGPTEGSSEGTTAGPSVGGEGSSVHKVKSESLIDFVLEKESFELPSFLDDIE